MPLDSAARAAQLAALLAEAPPRRQVPQEIRRAAVAQAAPMLVAVIGTFFGGIGIIVALAFLPWKLPEDWRLDHGATARGRVVAVERTSMSVNNQRVIRYEFTFRPASGEERRSECFTTGIRWREGAEVAVRYLPDDPAIARIEGARRTQGGAAMLFVLVFPVIGFGLVAWFVRSRRRVRNLLQNGIVTEAEVTAVEQTATRINRDYVQRILLKRIDEGGKMMVRHHQPAFVDLARQRLVSKEPVFVLYNPANPREALLPEALL